jgi:NADH:ubiquinone oxidoreductase subunit 4 (subunit M)
VVALAIICVNDDDGAEELSVELEIVLIVVLATSIGDEDEVMSMEVAYECDVDNDDRYSLEIDPLSVALIVFSLLLLEIAFVVVEINSVVDSSVSTDEVRSF